MNKGKSYLIIGGILLLSSIKSFAQEVGVNYFYGWGSLQNVNGEVYDQSSLEDRYHFSNTQGVHIYYAQEMIEKFPLTYYVSYQRSTLNFQFHLMEDVSFEEKYTLYNSYPIIFSDQKGDDIPYEGVYSVNNGVHSLDYLFNTISLGLGKKIGKEGGKLSVTPSIHWMHSKINTQKLPNLVYSTQDIEAPMRTYGVEFYHPVTRSFSDFRFNLSIGYQLSKRISLAASLELSTSGRRNRYMIYRNEMREYENASGQIVTEVQKDQFYYSLRYINVRFGLNYKLFK